jgi:hypothetical protein
MHEIRLLVSKRESLHLLFRMLPLSSTFLTLWNLPRSYIIPLSIALIAYVLRVIADTTCSSWSSVCRSSSDFLSHLYAVVLCFMLILAATKAQQIKAVVNRITGALELVMEDRGKAKKD